MLMKRRKRSAANAYSNVGAVERQRGCDAGAEVWQVHRVDPIAASLGLDSSHI